MYSLGDVAIVSINNLNPEQVHLLMSKACKVSSCTEVQPANKVIYAATRPDMIKLTQAVELVTVLRNQGFKL